MLRPLAALGSALRAVDPRDALTATGLLALGAGLWLVLGIGAALIAVGLVLLYLGVLHGVVLIRASK